MFCTLVMIYLTYFFPCLYQMLVCLLWFTEDCISGRKHECLSCVTSAEWNQFHFGIKGQIEEAVWMFEFLSAVTTCHHKGEPLISLSASILQCSGDGKSLCLPLLVLGQPHLLALFNPQRRSYSSCNVVLVTVLVLLGLLLLHDYLSDDCSTKLCDHVAKFLSLAFISDWLGVVTDLQTSCAERRLWVHIKWTLVGSKLLNLKSQHHLMKQEVTNTQLTVREEGITDQCVLKPQTDHNSAL